MTSEDIYDILTSLGYTLHDRGTYWQTNAVFRQGDNQTAIQIYKDTGVWRDFVNDTPPLKFERLVERSVGGDKSELQKILKGKDLSILEEERLIDKPKLTMENIYPEDSLKKLLPHYRFYNDKGISDDTLAALKGGLATQGQLYQRFVFPIYNELSQIHGFSGRDMLNKEGRPKWKHVGRKSTWVYPIYVPGQDILFSETLDKTGQVILVESIGDFLALYEYGYRNILVTFGLDISPAIITSLVQFNPRKIIISFNNDSESFSNRGLEGALKNYLKLLSYFDHEKLYICLPLANDFGDMDVDSFEKWSKKLDNIKTEEQREHVLKESITLVKQKKLSKKLIKNRFLLENLINE